ncbi:hypothetical protein GH714_008842 [Hevea brasiliensis]|uniref:Pentatricopeptide repeat-containing protein n=1 Tax=Hevea brasiliensis TaxID=3981 RepID=A0A6A6MKM0_HEVBR|nr:hypothetical protein GH714_008842 [Hevea brasiliensis]
MYSMTVLSETLSNVLVIELKGGCCLEGGRGEGLYEVTGGGVDCMCGGKGFNEEIRCYCGLFILKESLKDFDFDVYLLLLGRVVSLILALPFTVRRKTGLAAHFVQTALINMYGTLHHIADACKVFAKMPVKDLVAWNSMLDAHASNGQMEDAIHLFNLMPLKDQSSFNIMISGYSSCGEALSARSIFDKMTVKDTVSWNSMISAYTRAGYMEKAHALFREMPVKNPITWNTMITGCLQSEHFNEALDLFDEMKTNCIPDYLTVTSVLSACAHLGSLETGTKIHIYAIDSGLASSPHVTTALIEMYAKCGSIEQALQVFHKSQVKDIFCWNAMISGLALHGQGYAALELFDKMRSKLVRPDDITFIGLLNACSHSGLVQEGCHLFDSMQEDFGISPKLEHYGCMVDLLGRLAS